jgi:uncharacterized protein (TIGR02594 family)
MSNLKISRLALVLLSLFFVYSTQATATIREGNATTCYSSNIQHTKKCRVKKLITHTKKPVTQKPNILETLGLNKNEPVVKRRSASIPSPKPSVYAEAARYVGFTERRNTESLKILTGVNPRRTPWCAAFVNAVLNRKGYRGTDSHTASSFRNYGIKVSTPAKGDIVVIRSRSSSSGVHVGLFSEYKVIKGVKHIGILGGNQNNMVKVTYYPARNVITIRRAVA